MIAAHTESTQSIAPHRGTLRGKSGNYIEVNFLLWNPGRPVKSIAVTSDVSIDLQGWHTEKTGSFKGFHCLAMQSLLFNPTAGLGISCFVCSPGSTQQSSIMSNDCNIELHMTRNKQSSSL